jgi:hypothetical protein
MRETSQLAADEGLSNSIGQAFQAVALDKDNVSWFHCAAPMR